MRSSLLLSLTLILRIGVPCQADEIDDWVKAQMQARHVPAVSVAVVRSGVLVKAEGYGLADLEQDVPARADTVYKIGSVSKQFIATGVMLLVQDGRLALDEKVGTYLAGTPSAWQAITIRHLLTHTSGLVREAPGFDPYKVQPDIDVIRTAFHLPLNASPGDRYEYSNLGYYVLAEIISAVSGKPWAGFLNERVFVPVGMTATRSTTVARIIPNRAAGYVRESDAFQNAADWPAVRPSGAFLSTVLDLAKWEAVLQTNRILSESSKKDMWTPVRLNDGREYRYGFGWEVDWFPNGIGPTDVPLIRHEGSIPGFRAVYWRLPEHGLTVIVLSNLEGAGLDNLTAGIAVRYVPQLMPAYRKRWPSN
jgi:CubicO group peptidase (beta-lactamase class C family)